MPKLALGFFYYIILPTLLEVHLACRSQLGITKLPVGALGIIAKNEQFLVSMNFSIPQ